MTLPQTDTQDIAYSLMYLKSQEIVDHDHLPTLLEKDFPLAKQYDTTHEILDNLEEVLQSYNNQIEPYALYVYNRGKHYAVLIGKGDQGMVQVTNLIKDTRENPAPYQINFFSKYKEYQDESLTLLADDLLELEEQLLDRQASQGEREVLATLSRSVSDFKTYHDLHTEAYMALFTIPGLPYLVKLQENLQEIGMGLDFAFWE